MDSHVDMHSMPSCRSGILLLVLCLFWPTTSSSSSSAAVLSSALHVPAAAAFLCPTTSSSTNSAFLPSRPYQKRLGDSTASLSLTADYDAVLSQYGLSPQQSFSREKTTLLPGSTAHKVRAYTTFFVKKLLQLGLITLLSRWTNNRFRLGVNVVRWALLSFLGAFLRWRAQLTVSDPSSWTYLSGGTVDELGILQDTYQTIGDSASTTTKTCSNDASFAKVRQVPGNGSCLFYALAASLLHSDAKKKSQTNVDATINTSNDNVPASWSDIRQLASKLRRLAVDTLEDGNASLIMKDNETIFTSDLVNAIGASFGMTARQYCRNMRRSSCWGGGPEMVALSNALGRRIYLYQGCDRSAMNHEFQYPGEHELDQRTALHRYCYFGSPDFTEESVHILESRNHFMAVLPECI